MLKPGQPLLGEGSKNCLLIVLIDYVLCCVPQADHGIVHEPWPPCATPLRARRARAELAMQHWRQ